MPSKSCECTLCNGICRKELSGWDEFKSCIGSMLSLAKKDLSEREWIFRGVTAGMCLETTLERMAASWDIPLTELSITEGEIIREFIRKSSDYGIRIPRKPDCVWWVSVMQHHGAPTRLLDWTFSPYVAAYFALEKLLDSRYEENAAIWAIQKQWIDQAFLKLDSNRHPHADIDMSKPRSQDFLFDPREPKDPYVVQINSFYLHERLAVQQGVFLCPANVSRPFTDNFMALPDWQDCNKVIKLVLPRDSMKEAMYDLQKMNITRTSLFPGLDGFAHSLRTRFPFFNDLAAYRNKRR